MKTLASMYYNSFDNIGLVKVLSFLKSHNTEYLSGQDLSDVLKISRVAVWKHIKSIKELGYKIEVKQKLGYKLTTNTKKLLPWEVIAQLETKKIGKKAYYFDEIDSTQNYAINLANSKNENGSIVIAERQTHGKGRQERKWESPTGGIWFSVIIQPKLSSSALSLVPISVAVALFTAIKKTTKIETELKWPNDIMIESKKVAGIIIDATIESNIVEHIVIGIGINFDIDVKKTQKTLSKSSNYYGITSIVKHDKNNTKRIELLQMFLTELEKIIQQLEKGTTQHIIKKWISKSATIGKKVSTVINNKKISGIAIRIDPDGALIIKTKDGDDDIIKVLAEDITHLKQK